MLPTAPEMLLPSECMRVLLLRRVRVHRRTPLAIADVAVCLTPSVTSARHAPRLECLARAARRWNGQPRVFAEKPGPG